MQCRKLMIALALAVLPFVAFPACAEEAPETEAPAVGGAAETEDPAACSAGETDETSGWLEASHHNICWTSQSCFSDIQCRNFCPGRCGARYSTPACLRLNEPPMPKLCACIDDLFPA